MNVRSAWRHLGLTPTSDARLVRKAYADKLRDHDIASNPDAFAKLREARDLALANLIRETAVDDFGLGDVVVPPNPDNRTDVAKGRSPLRAPTIGLDSHKTADTIDATSVISDSQAGYLPVSRHGRAEDADLFVSTTITLPSFAFDAPEAAGGRAHGTISRNSLGPCEKLYALLLQHDVDEPLDAREVREAEKLVEAISREADSSNIETSEHIEAWLVDVLARAIPRSDPLIRSAGRYFRWEGRVQDRDLPPALSFLVARQKTMNFLAAVGDRKHRFHGAWQMLESPSKKLGDFLVKKEDVAELLAVVRRDHAGVEESYFDPVRVDQWDRKLSQHNGTRRGAFPWIFVVVVGLNLIRCAHTLTDGNKTVDPPRTAVVTLANPTTDITAALAAATAGELDTATLSTMNPKLYAILYGRWQSANADKQVLATYVASETNFLRGLVDRSVPALPYDVIADYRRLEIDRLEKARSDGVAGCRDALQGRFPANDEFQQREMDLVRKTLLAIDGEAKPRPTRWTYTIPGMIVTATSKRLGIVPTAFDEAMDGSLSSIDRCTARIALIRAALAAPAKVSLKLLREM